MLYSSKNYTFIIKTKNREIKVNALLDDGIIQTYLNEDIAWELGLTGEKRLVEVNVINGKSEKFETTLVNFILQNENRNMALSMQAQTTRNVTGKLKPIDWKQNSQKWPSFTRN